ncbi:hypothetical protein BDP27DRAFT_1405833 [Rhodocollybia butyracea]|uniref:Protein kinase domain-containing protein n=1 Tax=Rhodocollybia butyracea TaxID=206335 RepID=A0A9P5U294_9AGAR|nr:hypothetical protein BDP27DRAFT_1405833 [Rhodocollybia butyracea]
MLAATLAALSPGLLVGFWLIFRGTSESPDLAGTEPISLDLLRKKLPSDLTEWRTHKRYITSWNYLRPVLASHGYKLWSFDPVRARILSPPGWDHGASNGFLHISPAGRTTYGAGLGRLAVSRSMLWPARHDHGDVVVRVLSVGGQGERSLKIQRQVATPPEALMRSNHALPMFREIVLQDIVLGIYPRVTSNLADIFISENLSFMERDVMEVFSQCLEALDFLHQNLIAHLNITFDSFLVDFPPLLQSHVTRPPTGCCRVYITGFDYAVSFPASTPLPERYCYGESFFFDQSGCPRNKLKAPEIVDLINPFSPFPVDCWQFSSSCLALTIDPSDEELALNQAVYKLFGAMVSDDPTCRPSASEALVVLQNLIHSP